MPIKFEMMERAILSDRARCEFSCQLDIEIVVNVNATHRLRMADKVIKAVGGSVEGKRTNAPQSSASPSCRRPTTCATR